MGACSIAILPGSTRGFAEALPADALVVTLLPDSGERYLSKLNQTWMREHGLLDQP